MIPTPIGRTSSEPGFGNANSSLSLNTSAISLGKSPLTISSVSFANELVNLLSASD